MKSITSKTAVVAVALALSTASLAGCGSNKTQQSSSQNPVAGNSRPGGGMRNGASGTIAEVDGTTMQVQNRSTQTAVTWAGSTKIRVDKNVGLDAIKSGMCISVTPSADSSESVTTAAAVRVIGDTCDSINNRPGPGNNDGQRGPRQSDGRTPNASVNPPQRQRMVIGSVTKMDGGNITVSTLAMGGQTPAVKEVIAKTSSKTTYIAPKDGAASDIAVGKCVNAQGPADNTGKVAATSISLSAPVDGQCFGFGRGGGRG